MLVVGRGTRRADYSLSASTSPASRTALAGRAGPFLPAPHTSEGSPHAVHRLGPFHTPLWCVRHAGLQCVGLQGVCIRNFVRGMRVTSRPCTVSSLPLQSSSTSRASFDSGMAEALDSSCSTWPGPPRCAMRVSGVSCGEARRMQSRYSAEPHPARTFNARASRARHAPPRLTVMHSLRALRLCSSMPSDMSSRCRVGPVRAAEIHEQPTVSTNKQKLYSTTPLGESVFTGHRLEAGACPTLAEATRDAKIPAHNATHPSQVCAARAWFLPSEVERDA